MEVSDSAYLLYETFRACFHRRGIHISTSNICHAFILICELERGIPSVSISFYCIICARPPADVYTAALVSSLGRAVIRRYGCRACQRLSRHKNSRLCHTLMALKLGNSFLASSSLTGGATITSSPGTQLIGVVMRCLSPVCRESTMRRTSVKFVVSCRSSAPSDA